MGRPWHRSPLNWGTIGEIETVLEIRNRRWWPPEAKFEPNVLIDFCCGRRRIKNHPLCQACSDIHWWPSSRAHDDIGRQRRRGVIVRHSRRKAPGWCLERARGVVSTRWLPRWYRGTRGSIGNRRTKTNDRACSNIRNRRSPRFNRTFHAIATRQFRRCAGAWDVVITWWSRRFGGTWGVVSTRWLRWGNRACAVPPTWRPCRRCRARRVIRSRWWRCDRARRTVRPRWSCGRRRACNVVRPRRSCWCRRARGVGRSRRSRRRCRARNVVRAWRSRRWRRTCDVVRARLSHRWSRACDNIVARCRLAVFVQHPGILPQWRRGRTWDLRIS